MKEKIQIDLGDNLYSHLKANNNKVKLIVGFAVLVTLCSLAFAFVVYKQSLNRTYVMDAKGDLVPVSILDTKETELIQAKANLDLFVNYYYNLEGVTMKSHREKLLWLLGEKPKNLMKDRANRGYFNDFLAYPELRQRAYILNNTLKISSTAPYIAHFTVRVERQNKNKIDYYNNQISVKMEKVNKNYPYNPYGFLITDLVEEVFKVDNKKAREQEEEKHEESLNQISYE